MEYYEMTPIACAESVNTDIKYGLKNSEAKKRLLRNGKNLITSKKKKTILVRFFEQFNDFMIIILLCAAAMSFLTSMLFGDRDIAEPVIILTIVTFNAILGTVQEIRAEHSIESLKKLSAPTATVIREGQEIKINSEDVVVGDLLKIRTGDVICADCRLITSTGLKTDESSLTGETNETEKDASVTHPPLTPVGDTKNMVMASSSVTAGNATAIVVKTGMETEIGQIATLLMTDDDITTPLQKKLARTGRTLGIAALFICGIIFVIGTLKKIPPFEMFMTSVSLAVAAIPEGLPAIVTILLALGVVRMSRHNAIVRRLPSVETLGSATVICTDKTGTLTQNKMKVDRIMSYDSDLTLRLATLCTDDEMCTNPTDKAILSAAEFHGINTDVYKKQYKCLSHIPFDSDRKRMSVLRDNKIIVKGAIEYILPLCTHAVTGNGTEPMTTAVKHKIKMDNHEMTQGALRVIAVAYKKSKTTKITDESNLIFAGLIGIYDPPRPEAYNAVAKAKKAGVRTIMITGDHANTAMAIAKKTGIAEKPEKSITGTDIDNATDEELKELLHTYNVFARVTPHHKSRLINVLKSMGEIVAMTGDGVNDAPALKNAHIGCSMGINGTDVAKSASDIILTDDNFATIVYAIGEGRAIYDNIKKSVKFLLSSNIGEILTVFFSILLSFSAPLTASELLWVNLVTDSLPAIALGLDQPDRNIMQRNPHDPKSSMFSKGLWAAITLEGMMIGALTLLSYSLGIFITGDSRVARTMSFFVLSVSQLTHAYNMRSADTVTGKGFFSNKYLNGSFIIGILMQTILIYVSPLSQIFNVVKLNGLCLFTASLLSLMPLVLVELQKRLNRAIREQE